MSIIIEKKIIIDCNVEHPSVPTTMQTEFSHKQNFFYGYEYYRSALKDCLHCGKCRIVCENSAIDLDIEIDPLRCTGCAKCYQVCPAQAIERIERLAGYCFFSETAEAICIYGELEPGEKCAKELLAFVKKEAQKIAQKHQVETILNKATAGENEK